MKIYHNFYGEFKGTDEKTVVQAIYEANNAGTELGYIEWWSHQQKIWKLHCGASLPEPNTPNAEKELLELLVKVGALREGAKAPAASIIERAQQGDAAAQYSLGGMYFRGQGVTQDDAEAFKWFRKAAEQGDSSAQVFLGLCYSKGTGIAQDDKEAVKWYLKGVENGNTLAQMKLAYCYMHGHGVARDAKEAFKYYSKAADNGEAAAMYSLGELCEEGKGCVKDGVAAMKWYERAAAKGDKKAQHKVALIRVVEQACAIYNTPELTEEIKESARQGNQEDLLRWTCNKETGSKLGMMDAKKLIHAVMAGGAEEYYKLSLGIAYDKIGLFEKDKELAALWLKKAADAGYPGALKEYGDKALGAEKYDEAARYYSQVIKNGSMFEDQWSVDDAQFYYALCMILGLGVKKDASGGFDRLRQLAAQKEYTLGQAAAESVLKTGELDINHSLPFPQKIDTIMTKENTWRIADLEYLFSGERISEKYTTGSLAKIKMASTYKPSASFAARKDIVTADAKQGDIKAMIEWTRHTLEYAKRTLEIEERLQCLEDAQEPVYRKLSACSDLGDLLGPEDRTFGVHNELNILWYKKALELGCTVTGTILGGIYMACEDYEAGYDYYTKSAELGYDRAEFTCALCQICGVGTTQDIESGYQRIKKLSAISKENDTFVSSDARNALKTGAVEGVYFISVVGRERSNTLENEDKKWNISDLEYLFHGTRDCEKYFKPIRPYKII